MKKAFAIVIQFALLLPALVGALKLSSYFLELEKYKAQCKNRDNTEITCNGLCKLSEELSLETSENEPVQPLFPTIENILPLYYCYTSAPLLPVILYQVGKQSNNHYYKVFFPKGVRSRLEKPPTVG
ncbi:hypothetical protein JCM31826_20420 [Thermaurantimonas aggregans]|uniref:Uncharacterized protein n=1 Tax=Thermaurantimonas aggregans TaxID=2173829 RepID=A0A401XNI3_9FLAO|nr:hypothetical protein [Thermaurantimonas aggregans]MCX8149809.1 hypothetical protein [Thermaurantimonas aggregans]GCD78560.1 hypothetical protein JCM31826_20420 [Thermaurantimonas aggregans]